MPDNLIPKQNRFCQEYIIALNATQAAIRAGYSYKTANNQCARLLVNVGISEKILQLKKEQAERLQIEADRVILEIARIAFFDTRKFFDENGNIKLVFDSS